MLFGYGPDKRLDILYKKGVQKLDNDFNIVTLLNKLRHFEVMLEASLITTDQRKFFIEHSQKNCIEIDSEYSFSDSELKHAYKKDEELKSFDNENQYEGGFENLYEGGLSQRR